MPLFPYLCQATIGDTNVCDLCKAASIFAVLDQPTQSNNRHSRYYGLPDGKTPCQCQPLPSRIYHLLQSKRQRLNSAGKSAQNRAWSFLTCRDTWSILLKYDLGSFEKVFSNNKDFTPPFNRTAVQTLLENLRYSCRLGYKSRSNRRKRQSAH